MIDLQSAAKFTLQIQGMIQVLEESSGDQRFARVMDIEIKV